MGALRDSFARAYNNSRAASERPGPEIDVPPFAPGTVTNAAGMLKAITSMYAARRARANYQQQQQDKDITREHLRLTSEDLRRRVNEPRYSRGEGASKVEGLTPGEAVGFDNTAADNKRASTKQLTPEQEKALGLPVLPGGEHPASSVEAAVRMWAVQKAASGRRGSTPNPRLRYTAAKVALGQIDEEGKRWVESQMQNPDPAAGRTVGIDKLAAEFGKINDLPADERKKAAEALGIQPRTIEPTAEDFRAWSAAVAEAKANKETPPPEPKPRVLTDNYNLPFYDPAEVAKAIAGWKANRRIGLTEVWKSKNAPRYAQHQSVIEMEGGAMPADTPAVEAVDPLEASLNALLNSLGVQ